VLADVTLHEMIVFKDYSVDRKGEMKHASEYSSEEWINARDRRNRRRKQGESNTSQQQRERP
jgi:mannose-1-phosphate guanylyltransferase